MSDIAKENGNDVAHEKLEGELHITQPGYIYIQFSNDEETPVEVYFDDFTVTHNGSYVSQATDYGVWGDVIREQKAVLDTTYLYRYAYQGQFAEKDIETGWNHFELREYDAVIGRWLSKDPKGQFYSPYVGMGNNPVSGTDPDGGWLFGLFGSTSAQRQAARADANAFEGSHINNYFSKDINVTWEGSYLESPQPNLWSEKNLFTFGYNKDGSPGDLGLNTLYTSFSGQAEFDPLGQLTFAPGFGAAVGSTTRLIGVAGQRVLFGTGNRVFWSGGFEGSAGAFATEFAGNSGAITLEMTPVGRSLTWLTSKTSFSFTEPLWKAASWGFARGARGTANVFINPVRLRPGNIWIGTEREILRANGVQYQYHIIPH